MPYVAVRNLRAGTLEGLEYYADQAPAIARYQMYVTECMARGINASNHSEPYMGPGAPGAPGARAYAPPPSYRTIRIYNSAWQLLYTETYATHEEVVRRAEMVRQQNYADQGTNYNYALS